MHVMKYQNCAQKNFGQRSHMSHVTCHMFHSSRGIMLLELLIAIAAAAIVFSLGAQLTYVSARSSKIAADTTVALGLVSETHEAIRAAASEKWQNVFNLAKNSSHHAEVVSGKWVLLSGAATTTVNGLDYGRSFIVQNVCRAQTSQILGDITGITDTNGTLTTCTTSGGVYDPSSQKVTVTVSWIGSDGIAMSEYILRWQNKICRQTAWSGSGSGAKNCPDTTYDSKDSQVTAGDALYLQ